MREKINSDPKFQAIAVGVLLLVGVIFFMKMGKSDTPATDPTAAAAAPAGTIPTTDPAAPVATDPATGLPVAAAGAIDPATGLPVPVTAPAAPAELPPPTEALPSNLLAAYHANTKTVALLITRNGGIDDALVRKSVDKVSGDSGVAFFFAPAKKISKYAALTQNLGLDRVPALIVVHPADKTGERKADVLYGFRTAVDVKQAITDSRYKGPVNVAYAPK